MQYEVIVLHQAYGFIRSVPAKMRAKIYRTVWLLEMFGCQLDEPHAKTLTGYEGLKELRVKFASDICRLFYFHFDNRIYVVTSGYQKKDSKTDPREIERALRLMAEYKNGGFRDENV